MSYHITKDEVTGYWYIYGTGIFVDDVKKLDKENVPLDEIREMFTHNILSCPYCGWKSKDESGICEKCSGDVSKPSREQIQAAIEW